MKNSATKWNKARLERNKYVIVLLTLVNFILTPIHAQLLPGFTGTIVVINFTLVILTGLVICHSLRNNVLYYGAGILTLTFVWLEFSFPQLKLLMLLRELASLVLFVLLCYVLIKPLIKSKEVELRSILGAISVYLFMGLIGGVIFEIVNYMSPNSFTGMQMNSGYAHYYFSFISMTTVGYGDITPATPPAQAVTIILNIAGQLYLTIVVALFVGKFLNTNLQTR